MGDFSPNPGGRVKADPLRLFASGNTTGGTTSGIARSVVVSGGGDISVGYSSDVLIISGTAPVASGSVNNLFAFGNTTAQSSSTTATLTNLSFSGAGLISVGFSTTAAGAGLVLISASSAAQTVQTIGGLATGNTTGSSSSTTFDARSVTVSGAGIVSVGYSSNNILIVSATTAAQTVQTIGGVASGNTTGSSSSTTFDARSVTVSGAGIVSVGYSSNNILIVSATTAAQTVQTIGGVATGNTTGSSSSTTFDARSVTVSGAGIVSVGYSSNNILIVSAPTPAASGTAENMVALGNTTGATSSSVLTLTALSVSGAGGLSAGFSTTAAGAGVLVLSGATTAAQTVQTIGGFASGNTTGSSSSTTFDARSVTVSGAGDISVGYSSNNILIISGTAPVASGTVVNMSAIGNTTAVSSSSSQTLTAVSFSGAGGVSIGMSTTAAGSPVLVISGATTVASGTAKNLFALGNTTGQSSSTTVTLTNVSLSGAGIVSVGFSTTAAGAGVAIFSATTAAQTVQTIGGFATGNTTGSSSLTTFDARSVTVSGGGIVSVGYSSNNILIVSATSAASQGGLSFNAIGNTTGVTSSSASSIPETLTLSGAGNVSVGFSNSTIIISDQSSQNLFVLGNTTGQSSSSTVTLTNVSFSGTGGVSVGYSTTGADAGVLIISGQTSATSMGFSAIGNTVGLTSSMSQAITAESVSGAGGVSIGYSNGTFIISGAASGVATSTGGLTALGNTAGSTTTMVETFTSQNFSGSGGAAVGFSAGTIVISAPPPTTISFIEPLPLSNTSAYSLPVGTMALAPMAVGQTLSINQFNFINTRSLLAGTLSFTAVSLSTTTASASWGSSQSLVVYSRQGGTSTNSFSSFSSTTVSFGITVSYNISQSKSSGSVTQSATFSWPQGTQSANTSSMTTTFSSVSSGWSSAALNTASTAFSGFLRHDIPFVATFPAGMYLVGVMGSFASGTANTSIALVTAPSWSGSMAAVTYFSAAIGVPGATTNPFYGIGSTSSAGSVVAGTIAWGSLSSSASYPRPYFWAAFN